MSEPQVEPPSHPSPAGGSRRFVRGAHRGDTERLSVWPVWRCRGVMLRRFFMFAGLLVLPVLPVGESWAEVRAEGSEAQTELVTSGGSGPGCSRGSRFGIARPVRR